MVPMPFALVRLMAEYARADDVMRCSCECSCEDAAEDDTLFCEYCLKSCICPKCEKYKDVWCFCSD